MMKSESKRRFVSKMLSLFEITLTVCLIKILSGSREDVQISFTF